MKEQVVYLMDKLKNEEFKNNVTIDMLIRELLSLKMKNETVVVETEQYLKG